MGKLGSRELTAGSDVDVILLYDHDENAEESDGDKPLAPSQYYARLTQRVIAAVSALSGAVEQPAVFNAALVEFLREAALPPA
jgi:glutamine synthetase adenylyltransferase